MSDMNLDDLIRAGGNASRIINTIDGATNATIHNNIIDDDVCNGKKFHLSEKKAVKNIRTFLKKYDKGYKVKDIITVIFYIIALLIWFSTVLFFYLITPPNYYNSEGLIISILVGFILSVIVFVIANSVRHGLFLHRGYPYCQHELETLDISDKMIEHTYHSLPSNSRADIWILSLNPLKRPSEEYPNNRTVYRILKEDVEDIVYLPDCHMITITGKSKTIPYEDYADKNTIYRDGISDVSEYTFFLSLDEEECMKALETINKMHSIKNYMKDE